MKVQCLCERKKRSSRKILVQESLQIIYSSYLLKFERYLLVQDVSDHLSVCI